MLKRVCICQNVNNFLIYPVGNCSLVVFVFFIWNSSASPSSSSKLNTFKVFFVCFFFFSVEVIVFLTVTSSGEMYIMFNVFNFFLNKNYSWLPCSFSFGSSSVVSTFLRKLFDREDFLNIFFFISSNTKDLLFLPRAKVYIIQ